MDWPEREGQPRPSLADSLGAVASSIVCALFGHTTDPALPFCLWCGRDLPPQPKGST